tara:strand:+ start:14401 stop:15294 length:894 start_codon:yes stop_codon:yes gene_type:complete
MPLDGFKADYDFPIEVVPMNAVLDNQDVAVPLTMQRCIVRTDTNEPLGTVGKNYKPILHADIVQNVLDAYEDSNLSQDTEINISTYDNGAKLYGEIIFNDHVIEPEVGDIIKYRVRFYSSYDTSWAFCVGSDGFRVWCKNGCANPLTIAKINSKHTTHLNIEGIGKRMVSGLDIFMNQKELYKLWIDTVTTEEEVDRFIRKTICKSYQRSKGSTNYNKVQTESLLTQMHSESHSLGYTKWALYNAMTHWSTHTLESSVPRVTQKNREKMVTDAMKTNLWHRIGTTGIEEDDEVTNYV